MLKNIALSRKLILIVLAPLLGFLWLGTLYVNESYKTLRQMEYTVEASAAAQQVSQLITTLQRERGASGVFLGSQGRLMSRRLPGLRQATDEASNAVATLALTDDAQLAAGRPAAPDAAGGGLLPDGPVFLRSGGELVRVDLRSVSRVEADKDYVRLHGPGVRVLSSMKEMEARLPAPFVRVHRSHIVRLDRVEAVAEAGVVVAGDAVPVGASYRAALADRLPTL